MLVWPMAAKAPSAIEAMARKITICCHCTVTAGKAANSARTVSAMAASFGAAAKKAVTGVGAPS